MKTLKFLTLTLLAIVALASCSDSETYADMKKKERSAINRYIANQKIKVISEDVFNAQNQLTKTSGYCLTALAFICRLCARDVARNWKAARPKRYCADSTSTIFSNQTLHCNVPTSTHTFGK